MQLFTWQTEPPADMLRPLIFVNWSAEKMHRFPLYERAAAHYRLERVVGAAIIAMLSLPMAVTSAEGAGLVFSAPTEPVFRESTGTVTGSFDVLITNTSDSAIDLGAESVQIQLSDPNGSTSDSGVEFTVTDVNTVAPYIFDPSLDVDFGIAPDGSGIPYPKESFTTFDAADGLDAFTAINPGETFGLVDVSYSVASDAALGDWTMTFDPDGTSTSDQVGNAIPFTTTDGVLDVVQAPEPIGLMLLLPLVPLLTRRRRAHA
jgi:hypothetical protein